MKLHIVRSTDGVDAFVVVVNGHGEYPLGVLLTHDVFI